MSGFGASIYDQTADHNDLTVGPVGDAGSRCMDIAGNSTAPGSKVMFWNCNGVGGQQWVQQADGTLMNPQSGLCLTDPGGDTANGAQPDLAVAVATGDQRHFANILLTIGFHPEPD
ncbi:ricin-type beta-trefoil lectin domain protein [Catenulispora subtropica]|uniref:Ricin B lectin domain-containing protein n=1 Tax=Catenulispora subtropica TaxID=450798 RepID=A0ABN2TDL1_9ACTN